MSVEIVRLLLGVGASEREVEAVLASAASTGKSLAKTLVEQGSPLFDPLDRELVRRELPSIEIVRPAHEEMALLPAGLCERLGAVPVRRDARTGRVDVAALDPLDPHVAEELEFHLEARVRVLRARPEALAAALSGSTTRHASGPPLPLVRKARLEPLPFVTPSAVERAPAATIRDAIIAQSNGDDDEPVLVLSRPKPTSSARAVAPPSSALPLPPAEALSDVLAALEAAETLEATIALLIRGLAPARTLLMAVRGGAYEGRSASLGLSVEAARKVRLLVTDPSVIETAVRSGLYLGALPLTPVHDQLRELFGAESEVYVLPVSASGRPTLILLSELAALGSTVDATRRADDLAKAAGNALTRIVRSKKQRA